MMAINWKTSWPLVEAAILAHNKGHIIGTKKNGKPRYDLKTVLRTPHRHLLKEMVRLYSLQLSRYKWLHLTAALPPFHTNCVELANAMGLCKATIHNQLERLLSSGLITEKEHQGRHNSFKLRFAAEIIAIHPELEMRREIGLEAYIPLPFDNQAVAKDEAKNLGQVPDACPFKKENKLSVGSVENDVRGLIDETAKRYGVGGDQAPGAGNPPFQDGKKEGAGREILPVKCTPRPQGTPFQDSGKRGADAERPAPAPVSTFFEDYYIRLLAVIVGSLYRGIDFMAKSQLDAIKEFIHAQFAGTEQDQGGETYRQLWTRVGLAEKWVSKKPNRYIPLPGKYFAPDNPHGFNKTAVWLENMRMTNKRAETARERFQFLSKTVTAVLHSTGRHLQENGLHSYTARRKQVTDKYPHLATAFDWIVLDPATNHD